MSIDNPQILDLISSPTSGDDAGQTQEDFIIAVGTKAKTVIKKVSEFGVEESKVREWVMEISGDQMVRGGDDHIG